MPNDDENTTTPPDAKNGASIAKEKGVAAIKCPVGDIPPGVYVRNHFDMSLTARQSRAARRAFEGLHAKHLKLANGRHVDSPPDAIRWILEQLEPATPEEAAAAKANATDSARRIAERKAKADEEAKRKEEEAAAATSK